MRNRCFEEAQPSRYNGRLFLDNRMPKVPEALMGSNQTLDTAPPVAVRMGRTARQHNLKSTQQMLSDL